MQSELQIRTGTCNRTQPRTHTPDTHTRQRTHTPDTNAGHRTRTPETGHQTPDTHTPNSCGIAIYSLCIVSIAELVRLPTALLASNVYSPSYSLLFCTFPSTNDPSRVIWTFSMTSLLCIQRIVGIGTANAEQRRMTSSPAFATLSVGVDVNFGGPWEHIVATVLNYVE